MILVLVTATKIRVKRKICCVVKLKKGTLQMILDTDVGRKTNFQEVSSKGGIAFVLTTSFYGSYL
jgi:hypothetical protein